VRFSPTTLELSAIALWLLAFMAWSWGTMPASLAFVRLPDGLEGKVVRLDGVNALQAVLVMVAGIGVLVMIGLTLSDWPPNHFEAGGIENASRIVAIIGLSAVGAFLLETVMPHPHHPLLRLLARAEPWSPMLSDAPIRYATGVVRDPTPVLVDGQEAAFADVTDEEVMPGSDPNITRRAFANDGSFLVDLGHRTTIEVVPWGAHWVGATRTVRQLVAASGRPRNITCDALPVGATVTVAGNVEQDAATRALYMRVSAGAPLLILGGPAAEGGVRLAGLALRHRWIAAGVLVALGAVGAAGAWTMAQRLPPTQVTSGSGGDDVGD
jgi:hypothetical protein